jgi:hypothetical protein
VRQESAASVFRLQRSRLRPNRKCPSTRLHGGVTEKARVLSVYLSGRVDAILYHSC